MQLRVSSSDIHPSDAIIVVNVLDDRKDNYEATRTHRICKSVLSFRFLAPLASQVTSMIMLLLEAT